MKHEFEVEIEVNWNASHIEKVKVTTNNERNAIKLAKKKLSKQYSEHMMIVRQIKYLV